MKITFDNTEQDFEKNEQLTEEVQVSSELKNMIVNYVGMKKQPEDDAVTLQMVLDTFSEEFPEFVLPVAEENFIRGYNQALFDVDQGNNAMREIEEKENQTDDQD